jgi:ABC-type phosphate/phosphonate transport system substrate-binding protein
MIAALPMYDWPEVQAETDAFWHLLRDALHQRGIDAPDTLTRGDSPLASIWGAEALSLSQCCGWHVVSGHIGQAQVFARPVWDIAGLSDGAYCSAIIVRDDMRNAALPTLLRRPAINGQDSWSGLHVFRHWAALNDVILGKPVVSGSHRASIAAVREGRADIAAIDIASFTLADHLKETAGLSVLARSPEFPSVPFIHGPSVSSEHALAALREAITHPEAAGFRAALSLRDVTPAAGSLYDKMATVAAI